MSKQENYRERARCFMSSARQEIEYVEEGLCGKPETRLNYAINYLEQAAKLFELAAMLDRSAKKS